MTIQINHDTVICMINHEIIMLRQNPELDTQNQSKNCGNFTTTHHTFPLTIIASHSRIKRSAINRQVCYVSHQINIIILQANFPFVIEQKNGIPSGSSEINRKHK